MRCRKPLAWSVLTLLGLAVSAHAQPARLLPPTDAVPVPEAGVLRAVGAPPDKKEAPPITMDSPPTGAPVSGALGCGPSNACGSGCGSSCPCEKWGPTMPENVNLFGRSECSPWRVYGWVDMGYTYSSSQPGIMTVETRENRFSREFLANQIATVLEKPLKGNDFNWGFKALFYAGADAALLLPRGGFTTTDPRFGVDFRERYVSAHLPIFTEGGMDVKVGRMG